MQFTQESSNMSNLLELGPDFPLLISLFGYQSNARACSSLRYKTGHREMARKRKWQEFYHWDQVAVQLILYYILSL